MSCEILDSFIAQSYFAEEIARLANPEDKILSEALGTVEIYRNMK
jgi:hypothetical protein